VPARLSRILKTMLLLVVSLALAGMRAASEAGSAGAFNFSGLRLRIVSVDGTQTIGFTRFTVLRSNSTEEIKGETTYLDGERDLEDVRLALANPDLAPRLDTYEHVFYNADGTLQMADSLDAGSGVASCTSYSVGKAKVRKSQLEVPADSFAGASELIMVIGSLRQGAREIRFHAFACVPWPEIFSVTASRPDRSEQWSLYPGALVRLDMRPDLGPVSFLLTPFLSKMDAWFDPNDNWNYVGGEFDRYFRGPHVLTVRVTPSD
jgi:hypothetical protein